MQIGTESLAPPNTTSEGTREYMGTTPNLANKLKCAYSPARGVGAESNYSIRMADAYSSIRKSIKFSREKPDSSSYSNPTIRVKPLDTSYESMRN